VCAAPLGDIATDGYDDLCLLVTCCDEWKAKNSGGPVKLQNGVNVDCASVNCGNICGMACDRDSTEEPCDNICSDPTFNGTAYVFSRDGFCEPPFINRNFPTHVAFGFTVAPDIYLFGSVENVLGIPEIQQGLDNGFWMTTGTEAEMLATFNNPNASNFDGARRAEPYNEYRRSRVKSPSVCHAV
jgi:hypothetical protein